ncbi:MAG: hypothetical protein Q4B60_09585 [Erysipelotrichaceae bacterium]|nr:hypothetical protein [Erysipelotrichaceae bacterium]
MKKLFYLLGIGLLFAFPSAYKEDRGDWTGSAKWKDGWSEWSLVDEYSTVSVRQKIYLGVTSWGGSTELGRNVAVSPVYTCEVKDYIKNPNECTNVVKQQSGARETHYNSVGEWHEGQCGDYSNFYGTSCDGCRCALGPNKTDYCSDDNNHGACGGRSHVCTGNPKLDIAQCYYYKVGYQEPGWTEWKCGNSETTGAGCGAHHSWYYSEHVATSYADANNKANWRKSLAEAGGFGIYTYVYSYPMEFYINFDGNGANGICNFVRGSNNIFNNDTTIKYDHGNPVCDVERAGESMDVQAIKYQVTSETDKDADKNYLNTVQYYRHGYDFQGWAANPNATTATFSNGQFVTKTDFLADPGETYTLYAVWKIHTYNITYKYLCGTNNSVTTYHFQDGTKLSDLITTGANDTSSTKCDKVDGDESYVKFIGWYENPNDENVAEYITKHTSIPKEYYKDLTLYAKERQKRYYNYSTGRWSQMK